MASPAFRINGGAVGAKASVSASAAVTATIDNTDGIRQVEWSIIGTDETTSAASYTLNQSGSVGQTVSTTALTAGTAAILKCRINGGINLATDLNDPTGTVATAKFFVPTGDGLEVGCAGEVLESNATFGTAELMNEAIRAFDGIASGDASPTPDTLALRGSSGQLKAVWFQNGDATVASSGLVRTANNFVAVAARNAANTADISLLSTNGSNRIIIGEQTDGGGISLSVPTGADVQVLVNNSTTVTIGSNITIASASGKVSASGVDLVSLISGGVTVGDDATAGLTYRVSSGNQHTWMVNGISEMSLTSSGLSLQDTITADALISTIGFPATTGLVRAERDSTAVAFRNAANSANLSAVAMEATDKLVFGDGAGADTAALAASTAHEFRRGSTAHLTLDSSGLTFGASQTTLISRATGASGGNEFRVRAQGGASGFSGGNLVLQSGTGGSGADPPGNVQIQLNDDGTNSGTMQILAGAFGTTMAISYNDGSSAVSVATPKDNLTIDAGTSTQIMGGGYVGVSAGVSGGASRVGFFGSIGATKPAVSGSRGGNAALASLLTALASLGLITDSTSA